ATGGLAGPMAAQAAGLSGIARPGAGIPTPLTLFARTGAEAGQPRLPATEEALAELIRLDPTVARQTLQSVLPRADGALAGALLLFLSAARGGDVRGWLGDRAHRTLETAGRGDTLARLGGEIAQQGRIVADPATGDWRSYALPFYDDGQLSSLRLHVHGRGGDGEEGGGSRKRPGDGARFLIDMDLSRLGPLQLDGLIRRVRFALTLRSRRPLEAELRRTMAEAFSGSCAACGFDGAMTFETDPGRWVRVGEPARPSVDA
ncbi:MAG: hypothetical protein RID91_01690, partial [Azospirillaceae bacterium]